jgi:DDHD domain
MTPTFCETVLECVTQQINDTYEVFKQVHPKFEASGGKVSLVGHSLGSVIVWDLLTILKDFNENNPNSSSCKIVDDYNGMAPMSPLALDGSKFDDDDTDSIDVEKRDLNSSRKEMKSKHVETDHPFHGTWGPTLSKKMKHVIQFQPECTVLLGSPLGMFLSLRGAHGAFNEIRIQDEKTNYDRTKQDDTVATLPKYSKGTNDTAANSSATTTMTQSIGVSSFVLPTTKFFNIFHPR